MRVITLDTNQKVISVKNVGDNYVLNTNDLVTDLGDMGQIKQADGSFINDSTPPLPQGPTLEEKVSELKIQSTQTSNDLMEFMDFYFANQPV